MNALVVDPRAGSKTLIEPLRALGVRVEVEQMAFGDVSFMGNGPEGPVNVGCEHKRLGDVLSCIVDGRFAAHQLPGLRDSYSIVYLVVQGEWKRGSKGELLVRRKGKWSEVPWGRRQWMYSALEHWLATMEEQGGVHVARTRDTADSAAWIKHRATWWWKEWEKHDGLNTFHRAALPSLIKPGITRRMAKEIPGVAWELSDRVARHFGTPKRMVNASEEEWMQIEGIGKGKAHLAAYLMEHGKENGCKR